jgi:hypothetical protein
MASQESTALHTDQLIGTWHLRSFEGQSSDGEVRNILGTEPVGMLTYDPKGYVLVVLMRPDRLLFASDDRLGGTDQEVRAAFEGFEAYCGTFTLDPEQGTVTHHLVASKFPNWIGSNQVRHVTLAGDTLRLSTPPIMYGGKEWTFHLVWQRASQHYGHR